MRTFIALAFAAVMLTGCITAPEPFDFNDDRPHEGIVIIALDNPPADAPILDGPFVTSFDPVNKTRITDKSPSVRTFADFQLVTDDTGHNFLVGPLREGDAMIEAYSSLSWWRMYYNAGTYHFHVTGGAYNFIGRFNDGPANKVIGDAITAGKLPASTQVVDGAGHINVLYDQTLTGFTPAENRPGDKDLVAALAAKRLGHSVNIVVPTLTRTDFVMPGRTPSTPAADATPVVPPAAPVAPAADGAAKPSSATVTWVSRPKAP